LGLVALDDDDVARIEARQDVWEVRLAAFAHDRPALRRDDGDLCGAGEGTQWRDRMQDLIASEDPNPAWRMRLMDNYNRGYQAYERTYHGCTPAAARAAEIYVAEGKDLTGTIKARYAN
jgi:uncharacterized protein (TIGR02301 family)